MFGLAQHTLSLDWDRRSLRLVSARVSGTRLELADAHARRIPAGVDPEDPAQFGAFIAETLKQYGVRQSKVVVAVPRDKAVINRLRLAPTPATELAAAVRFQALRELPFPLDDAQIDYVIMERDAGKNVTEVLLAAVRNEVLDKLRETCRAAGLSPVRIGLRPYSNLVSVLKLPAMVDRRVLFIDVGPSVTEMDVFRGDALVFSRAPGVSVPFHEGNLVSDDSVVLSAKAEVARLDKADEYESSAVEELLVEVTRTLQAYRAAESSATIDQVIIAGGTGIENALLTGVDERFGFPTMLFDPTMALGLSADRGAELRSFAANLGMVWGDPRPGAQGIDFLNPKRPIPRKETVRKQIRSVGVAAAILVGGAVAYAGFDYWSLSNELGQLKQTNSEPARKVKAQRDLKYVLNGANDWSREAQERMWLEHLSRITAKAVEVAGEKTPESETNGDKPAGKNSDRPKGSKVTEKLLVTQLTCDGEAGRISLKIACNDWDIASRLEKQLNEIKNGKSQAYLAKAQKWTQAKAGDSGKFQGNVQIDIDLLDLQKLGTNEKSRETSYRKDRDAAL